MHHLMRGIDVSEEAVCLDLIAEQGIGGNFLGTDHTYRHFREELFLPRLSDRDAHHICDMVEAAHEEVERILAQTPPYTRDPAVCAEIDRLYKAALARMNQPRK